MMYPIISFCYLFVLIYITHSLELFTKPTFHFRTSHTGLDLELSVTENEIGSVIMGSLKSAKEKRPLTRKEHLNEIISNIPTYDTEGWARRDLIYDKNKQYQI